MIFMLLVAYTPQIPIRVSPAILHADLVRQVLFIVTKVQRSPQA
jgi:hypothetical protein